MSLEGVHKLADAILYEGYLLYPYRPSSVKNRQRWTFGGLFPPGYAEQNGEASSFQAQLLVTGPGAILDVELRFLHLRATRKPGDESWQDARERSVIVGALSLSDLLTRTIERRFAFSDSCDSTSRQERVQGTIEISAAMDSDAVCKVTLRVANQTPADLLTSIARDEAAVFSLIAAHATVCVSLGEFISLTDPPERFRDAAALCTNRGVWPVLAGEPSSKDCMLISPIILSDYPQIAPESAGDLFDGTEIDEILTLRILTMTDAEKNEMRNADERARRLLERTEALSPEQLMNLHGILRYPH